MAGLDKIITQCCITIESMISTLNNQDNEILHCKTEIENTKRHASDIQAFMYMKEIQKRVTKHEKIILSIVEDKQIERIDIVCTIDALFSDIFNDVWCNYCKEPSIRAHRDSQKNRWTNPDFGSRKRAFDQQYQTKF